MFNKFVQVMCKLISIACLITVTVATQFKPLICMDPLTTLAFCRGCYIFNLITMLHMRSSMHAFLGLHNAAVNICQIGWFCINIR